MEAADVSRALSCRYILTIHSSLSPGEIKLVFVNV